MARFETGLDPQEHGQLPQAIPFGKTESSPFHASPTSVNKDQRKQILRRFFEEDVLGSHSESPKMGSPSRPSREDRSPRHVPLSSPDEDSVPFDKTFSRRSNFSVDSEPGYRKRTSFESVLTDYGDDLPYVGLAENRATLPHQNLNVADSGVLAGCQPMENFAVPSGARASAVAPDGDRSFPMQLPTPPSNMLPVKIESSIDPRSPSVLQSPTSALSPTGSIGNSNPSNWRIANVERERREQERLLVNKREREMLVQSQRGREQAFMMHLQREREELRLQQRSRDQREQEQVESEELFWQLRQQQQQLLPEQLPTYSGYPLHPSHGLGLLPPQVPAAAEQLQASSLMNNYYPEPALPLGPSWPGERRGSAPASVSYAAPSFGGTASPHAFSQQPEQQPVPSHMSIQRTQQQLQVQQQRQNLLDKKQQGQRQQRHPQHQHEQPQQQQYQRQQQQQQQHQQTPQHGYSTPGNLEPGRQSAPAEPPQLGEVLTTVMMRNLPVGFSRDMLTDVLNEHGLVGCYDFIYMPINFRTQSTFGYAFVNFCTEYHAQKTHEVFGGFKDWCIESDRVCEVSWSDMHQGLAAHVDRYRNSPVMHETVPDEYKPVMFTNGIRVAFPPPTKKIRVPRIRRATEDVTESGEFWDEQ